MNVNSYQHRKKYFLLPVSFFLLFQCAVFCRPSWLTAGIVHAQEEIQEDIPEPEKQAPASVELTGDTVEYSIDGNKIIAEGNVVIVHQDTKITCDRVEFSRDTKMAYAIGHVHLFSTKGAASELTGEKLTFNFGTMSGTFDGATIAANPYYGYGDKVSKVGENHIQMENNYITTCDLDKPHFRLISRKMDMYPGEKMVARHVRMVVGKLPLLYIPKFTQNLKDKKPKFTFTPGYSKNWGMFVLSRYNYYFDENFKGALHLDAREKKDVAWGVDLDYKTRSTGTGNIRTYYMNERSITSRRFWQPRPTPTIERERFKAEWRHKWDINDKTNAILQYYKLSDDTLLKDYFEREFDKDSSPDTFFLLTRTLPSGTFSFRTDARVNRFESAVERLPELRYDLTNQKLGETDFYLRNITTYSNLTGKNPSPTEVRRETMRVDTDNELSYPFKVGFVELKPFLGGRNTYYSKTKDPEKYDSIRGIFRTGASLSTRFYRVFDAEIKKYGLEVNRLRHIITPTVAYEFDTEPTLISSQLDAFDSVDTLTNLHNINFSFENKLQTKRNNETVELVRAVIGTDFHLKEHPAKGGFDKINTDIDFRPVDWVTFYFDSQYDTQEEYLSTANFDMYINGGDKWSASIGKRWNRDVDDQLTTGFTYKLNPKWAMRTYSRFDLEHGILKEQEYALTRDLHEWQMDINFNEKRAEGNEIWLVFTLKAFPEMALDLGTSFNKRKAGSQSQ